MSFRGRDTLRFFSIGDLAFAVVVCASYASAAAALIFRPQPITRLAVTIAVAVLYLILGTYGFVLVRRSASRVMHVGYFLIQLSLATILTLKHESVRGFSIMLLPLAGQSAFLLSTRLMVPICVLIFLMLIMPLISVSRWVDVIPTSIVHGAAVGLVVLFTRMAVRERAAQTKLAEANQRLREHAAQVEELATTKERNRLAREIHDSLGHYLTVVNVQIGAAHAMLSQDQTRAEDHLLKAQNLTQEGLAEVRRSVAALRSSPIDGRPLPYALTKLIEQWNTAGINATLQFIGEAREVTPQVNVTLYRATQEALTNVSKHAQATQVEVVVDYTNQDSVRLRVADDGVGSSYEHAGFGLLGVRERVELLRGEMRARSESGKGFMLEVELPA